MALQGFVESDYLAAKLAALQADSATATDWAGKTTAQLKTFLANVGFTPESHYQAYGWAEGLAPNALFNAAEYKLAKATDMFNKGLEEGGTAYNTVAEAEAAFDEAWPFDPYLHYVEYGSAEGINPSNDFDESAYLASKLADLKADSETATEWADKTVDDVKDAFVANGLSALGHYQAYGEDEGIAVTEVPAGEKVDVADVSNPGETFTLTDGVDTSPDFDGTSGNDLYVATDATFTTGDDLDGKDGTDTLRVTFADGSVTPVVDLTSIENVTLRNADATNSLALDGSGWTGVEKLTSDRAADDVTVNNLEALPTTIGITKGGGFDLTVNTTADLSGTDDAVTLELTSADVGALLIDDAAAEGVEDVSIVNSGDSVLDDIQDGAAATADVSSLTVTGSGSLDMKTGAITYAGLTTVASTGVALELQLTNTASTAGTDTSVTSTGTDDDITVTAANGTAANAAVTTVSLGDGDNTVNVTDGTSLQEVEITTGAGEDAITLDVSNATVATSTAAVTAGDGDDTLAVTANAAGNVALAIDMGAGDDEITIDTVTEDDSIDGGADTDTIRGTTAALAAIEADADQLAAIVNFEQLAVTDAVANDVDLTEWGFNKISIEDGGTSAGTITMDSDDTIAFDEAAVLGADTSTGLIVADVDGASGAGSGDDVVNLEANVNFTGTFDFTALVDTAFVETVNIAVTDTATATVGTGYAEFEIGEATRIQTINVSASQETIVAEASAFPQDLFVALNTFNASDSTAKVTVDVTNATQGVTMTGGEGDDDFTGSAFADIVDMGDGDNTYMASGGADAITLGAGANNLDYSVAAGDSTEANMDTITGFNAVLDATKVDTLTTLSGAIDVDSAADTDVSAADVDAGTVTANITDGMIELGGADAANIDTLAEWIDVAEIMVTVDAGVAGNVGFEFDGNTYVLDANAANATSNVVELTGVTGATLGAAAAADVIVIA